MTPLVSQTRGYFERKLFVIVLVCHSAARAIARAVHHNEILRISRLIEWTTLIWRGANRGNY
jgi:hypothetical protein